MYSTSIIREGNTFRLDLISNSTGDIHIESEGLLLTYDQQDNDLRYQPSIRGSLSVIVVSNDKLINITYANLYKDDVLIFRGKLDNLDDIQDEDNPSKYITTLDFGDHLSSLFNNNSIGSDKFCASTLSDFDSRCRLNIQEAFQDRVDDSVDFNLKSDLRIRVDDNDVNSNLGREFNYEDEKNNLFFDLKPYFENDLSALESLEDCCKSILSKCFFIGDQLNIIQEKQDNYNETVNINYNSIQPSSTIYKYTEPNYIRKLSLLNESKQNILINEKAIALDEKGTKGYVAISNDPVENLHQCYIKGSEFSSTDIIKIVPNFANNAHAVSPYVFSDQLFNYSIDLSIQWNTVAQVRNFEAWIVLAYVTSDGHHFYFDSSNNWVYVGYSSVMSGLSTEILNLYDDTYYTVKNTIQSDVNSEKLSFSGDLQTSIGTSLASAQSTQGISNGEFGSYYLFVNKLIESKSGSYYVGYYTINSVSLTSEEERKIENYEDDYFVKTFDIFKDSDNEEYEVYASNNIFCQFNGGRGLISSKFQYNDTFMKNVPYYFRSSGNYSSKTTLGCNITGNSDFSKSLGDSCENYQNSFTGNKNTILDLKIRKFYIPIDSKIEYQGNYYFPTKIENNIESGDTKIKMINFNE